MLTKSCLIAAAALVCLASALPQIENINNPNRIPGEYLITLKPSPSQVQGHKASYVQQVVAKIIGRARGANLLKTFDALKSPVVHIQADDLGIGQAFDVPEVVNIEANLHEKVIKREGPRYCTQQHTRGAYWSLERIGSRSIPGEFTQYYRFQDDGGWGVRVYVLDTGVRTSHWSVTATFGTNTIGGSDEDENGHGTHNAGIISGGNIGIAKGLPSVVSVKVADADGFGTLSSLVDGINWAIADMSGRKSGVISMSVAMSASSTLDNAAESAVAAGIVVSVAAGNENQNACVLSPGRSSEVITVGATDRVDNLSTFSNWGSCVDILAPGTDILSADIVNDQDRIERSGTSSSAAHMAAIAAIYMGNNPDASPAEVKTALLSDGTKDYIDLRGTVGTPNILSYTYCTWIWPSV